MAGNGLEDFHLRLAEKTCFQDRRTLDDSRAAHVQASQDLCNPEKPFMSDRESSDRASTVNPKTTRVSGEPMVEHLAVQQRQTAREK